MELFLQALLMVSIMAVSVTYEDLPPGSWGGQHISLEVTVTGSKLEFDCAHGEFYGKLKLDRQGKFNVEGIYVEEHGGPTREANSPKNIAVIYAGQISGNKMKLTIKRKDSKKSLGAFTLKRGEEPFIVKCR